METTRQPGPTGGIRFLGWPGSIRRSCSYLNLDGLICHKNDVSIDSCFQKSMSPTDDFVFLSNLFWTLTFSSQPQHHGLPSFINITHLILQRGNAKNIPVTGNLFHQLKCGTSCSWRGSLRRQLKANQVQCPLILHTVLLLRPNNVSYQCSYLATEETLPSGAWLPGRRRSSNGWSDNMTEWQGSKMCLLPVR